MTLDEDELKAAIAKARDKQLAELVTLAIGLAAENHPEEIKRALSGVFDLKVIEETTTRMMVVVNRCWQAIAEMQPLLGAVHRDLDEIDTRIDAIREWIERTRNLTKVNGQPKQEARK